MAQNLAERSSSVGISDSLTLPESTLDYCVQNTGRSLTGEAENLKRKKFCKRPHRN